MDKDKRHNILLLGIGDVIEIMNRDYLSGEMFIITDIPSQILKEHYHLSSSIYLTNLKTGTIHLISKLDAETKPFYCKLLNMGERKLYEVKIPFNDNHKLTTVKFIKEVLGLSIKDAKEFMDIFFNKNIDITFNIKNIYWVKNVLNAGDYEFLNIQIYER